MPSPSPPDGGRRVATRPSERRADQRDREIAAVPWQRPSTSHAVKMKASRTRERSRRRAAHQERRDLVPLRGNGTWRAPRPTAPSRGPARPPRARAPPSFQSAAPPAPPRARPRLPRPPRRAAASGPRRRIGPAQRPERRRASAAHAARATRGAPGRRSFVPLTPSYRLLLSFRIRHPPFSRGARRSTRIS